MLVIGAGPAGLVAALSAARSKARVVLVDENATLGGRAIDDASEIDGKPAKEWVQAVGARTRKPRQRAHPPPHDRLWQLRRRHLRRQSNASAITSTRHPRGVPRQRVWRIVAKQTVLASGATERPLVFGSNDRPGVMLAGAVRTYINRFGVLPGRRVIVFTNNDYGATTATDLKRAGAEVVAIVDTRRQPSDVVKRIAGEAQTRLISGGVVAGALGRHTRYGRRRPHQLWR